MKILYVEDDLEVLENYTFVLQNHFGETIATSSGKDALEFYKKEKFDLVILDINLPDLDGLEIAREIRKKDFKTKIIMLTAYSDRKRLLDAINLNLEHYFIKPVSHNFFIETITTILNKKNLINQSNHIFLFPKGLSFDTKNNTISFENNNITLTKKELILLSTLIKHTNSYVDKDFLIMNVWESEIPDYTYDQKLVQLIYRLNKKIMTKLKYQKAFIVNHYSIGYKIDN